MDTMPARFGSWIMDRLSSLYYIAGVAKPGACPLLSAVDFLADRAYRAAAMATM